MKHLLLLFALICSHFYSIAQLSVTTNGQKHVLIEQITSANVTFSTDGISIMEDIMVNRPNTIGLMHHSLSFSDSMRNSSSDAVIISYNIGGIPSAMIDRRKFPGENYVSTTNRNSWDTYAATQLLNSPQFDITITYEYDNATREITANVHCKALATLPGVYTTNLYIVEDSVTGVGMGYDQRNGFNNFNGHKFFGKGDPILGYAHMNVVRHMVGGTFGDPVFNNPVMNDTGSNTYTYTLPQTFDAKNTRLVATIAQRNTINIDQNEVLNAISTPADLLCSYTTPAISICAATTDTLSGKNAVVWDTTGLANVIWYKIYRNDGSGYVLLDSVAGTALSLYVDASSTPGKQSYKYKIAAVNDCGEEQQVGVAPESGTMHLQFDAVAGSKNYISWSPYIGQTFSNYTIMRSNNGGAFIAIGQVAASTKTYTDDTPPAGSNEYRVDIALANACSVGMVGTVTTIKSNKVSAWPVTVRNLQEGADIQVSPNPSNGVFNISWNNTHHRLGQIQVTDMTGRIVHRQLIESVQEQAQLTLSNPAGIYSLLVELDGYTTVHTLSIVK